MKLEQQVVSLELAQKMKELGFKQDSYFNWNKAPNDRCWITDYHAVHLGENSYYSAYNVAELGEMLPANIEKDGFLYWLVCKKEFLRNVERTPMYIVSYESQLYGEVGHTNLYNEADARAKMLIYLVENKIITL